MEEKEIDLKEKQPLVGIPSAIAPITPHGGRHACRA
jgi:hypothetical protein